jgi:hygromycin-B 4-O-kinase
MTPSSVPLISLDAVRAFLTGRFGGGIAGLSPLAAGEWSCAFAFRRDGGEYVIRFSRVEEDFAKDKRAAGFAPARLSVPRILETGEAFDGFYAISERAFGAPLDSLTQAEMSELLPSLFETLDAIRDVDITGSTGYGGWGADGAGRHASWLEALLAIREDRPGSRISGWRAKLAASSIGDSGFDEGFACLAALAERCPEARYLVHSDLLNNNVLVSGGRIAAVLDWGSSIYGDFLYDLAWLKFCQMWYPAWRGIDFKQAAARHYEAIGLDVPQFERRLSCCELHIGLGSQVYNAFKDRWALVEQVTEETLQLTTAAPS